MERVSNVTAERDDLLVRLNDNEVPKENFKRKILEKDVILKDMTASVKQLKKKLGR